MKRRQLHTAYIRAFGILCLLLHLVSAEDTQNAQNDQNNSFDVNFYMGMNARKCFSEIVPANTLFLVHYEIEGAENYDMNVDILARHDVELHDDLPSTDQRDHVHHQALAVSGKFAETSSSEGSTEYEICFFNRVVRSGTADQRLRRVVRLYIRYGVDARDYAQIATRKHMQPLEVELERMRDMAISLRTEVQEMNIEDHTIASVKDSTNNLILYMSLGSLVVLVGTSLVQYFSTVAFFRKSKLL